MNDDDLKEVNELYSRLTSDLLLSGVDPIVIAGVMTASGMKLYNQSLSKEEFESMRREILKVKL